MVRGHSIMRSRSRYIGGIAAVGLASVLNMISTGPAVAWGDEGHQVVALVAQSFLDPAVRKRG